MIFDRQQTHDDPTIKYLLTQLDHHTAQVEAMERTKASFQAVLDKPPHDHQSHEQAQAAIDHLNGALISQQHALDSVAGSLANEGVTLTAQQARRVTFTPVTESVEE